VTVVNGYFTPHTVAKIQEDTARSKTALGKSDKFADFEY
jgi:hypothetical protein